MIKKDNLDQVTGTSSAGYQRPGCIVILICPAFEHLR